MDVGVKMWMWEGNKVDTTEGFDVLAFYPGRMQNSVPNGKYWSDFQEDRSLLRIGNLINTAYKLNYLVIYKKSDKATQSIINAHLKKTRLEGKLDVHLKGRENLKNQNQGSYTFDFKVGKVLANNTDEDGHIWDIVLLKIIDKTEDMSFPV